MQLLGNKKSFSIGLERDEFAYQLAVYIEGRDILQFNKNGVTYNYRWNNCEDIIQWIHENLQYILSNDDFPIEIPGDSAANKCANVYMMDFDDIQKYERLQEWIFRHSWFSARAGSYLADIYFTRSGNKIEISWTNRNTFKEDGIVIIIP